MAKLVLAAGVPHPPRLVREMQDAPGQLRGEALFKQVAGYFEAAAPDVIIELDSDHFVQFFYYRLKFSLLEFSFAPHSKQQC